MLERFHPLNSPLIVALDVDSDLQALKLANELAEFAGGYKIGPRLIHRYGPALSQKIAQIAPLFVDCKFFDIPSTMEAAVQASFDVGASLVTVHALSGQEALTRLAELEKKLNQQRPFRILCVTILTSWDEQSIPSNMKSLPVVEHVKSLVELVQASGLSGIVCSPDELSFLKDSNLYLVTPGIRPLGSSRDDQKRTKTPFEAMESGASALVIGRPIIEAADPKRVAMEISISMLGT